MRDGGAEAVIESYLRDCVRRGLAERTVESYGERLRVLEASVGRPLHTATRDQLQQSIDGRGSPSSIAAHRSTAVGFFRWCEEEGYGSASTAERTKAPKVRAGLPRPIDQADINRAVTEAGDPRLRAAILLGALAGLRVAEMAALRWPAVDMAGHMLEVVGGKGGRTRVVPLHPRLEAALSDLHPARRGPVLRSRSGAYRPRSLGQLIAAHLRACGIEATAHQLRHSFGTAVYAATHDIRDTSKLLGHASVTTTEVYARWDMRQGLVEAVRAIA